MKTSWNEMTTAQKIEAIVLTVLFLFAAVFAILDWSGKWPNNLAYLFFGADSLFEGIMNWNRNRKLAILEVVAAVFFFANGFLG